MEYDDQERCAVCGKVLGAEEGMELIEGYLCDECNAKLSPWFEDPDCCADADEIRDQIQWREENKVRAAEFRATRTFGESLQVWVDDHTHRFLITDQQDPARENTDVFGIDQVIGCDLEIGESKEKLDREDDQGKTIYAYTYDFELSIVVDVPFLDEIRFALNAQPLVLESSEKSFLGFGGFDPEENRDYQRYVQMGEKICNVLNDMEED